MMKKLLVALLLYLPVGACAQGGAILYPKLSKTLDSLAYVDQWPMQRLMEQQPDSAGRDLYKVQKDNFARHQPILEAIVKRYGYPGFRQVGEQSANNFWLLVQHADAHPEFQQRILKLMKEEVKKKNASHRNYAYLTDRVAEASGQPQEYGTQVVYKGAGIGKAEPKSLRDPQNVNKRRAAIGMETLEEYLEMNNKMHEQMNAPKPASL
ncbi:DUF6624 domain-containing protein [Hymenobacter sp. APR13]|uniref:DUF6624 domain-containing protein n=1 Tax=Hymenobacter sp. APR13 TaxID=1356852 RepID=UPI0004E09764|nr:DUF6624 domain-containing protein [Hymenobacter sp. APR13]AII52657.1 hypothetical protein N008_11815 [Hymenobacter sp. APR13]